MEIYVEKSVVVITGASRGLGRAIAMAFLNEGAFVIANYNKSEQKAKDLLKFAENTPGKCFLIKADISSEEEVKKFYKIVETKCGKIDVLINNAGIIRDNPINSLPIYDWDSVINTNLRGTFLCCKYFSKIMINQNSGKIINISSIKGQKGSANQSNYAASKAGVIALTKSLAMELGDYNIQVNAICPGFIETEMNRNNKTKLSQSRIDSVFCPDFVLSDLINFTIFISSNKFQGVSGRIFNLDSRL
ncbi:SDR family NAD(P)-dependent oxidoreductase [Streptococcus parasanguinis]|uniref:SDR family NAD(P)-dependent oxidoreductase n=1 Tax=Streptococcus parasanguinis TaxID=1318 RepID=UPI0039C33E17